MQGLTKSQLYAVYMLLKGSITLVFEYAKALVVANQFRNWIRIFANYIRHISPEYVIFPIVRNWHPMGTLEIHQRSAKIIFLQELST